MECKICNKICNNNSGLISHIKRKHNMLFNDYINIYYKEDKPIEKCGNCNNDACFIYRLDEENNSYTRDYRNRYLCNTLECKNDISMKILNEPYDPIKFEHIGSNPLYISIIRKISLEEAKYVVLPNRLKRGDEIHDKVKSNLKGYILRYGEIDGPIKYKERCDKIGKTNTLEWYIDKYGYDEGKNKYNLYILKLRKATTGTRISKVSQKIKTILDKNNIKYEEEYPIHILNNKKPKIVDYYLIDYNICLEFFGDYWHCNPKIYNTDYYHKLKKKHAYEIWNDDNIRNRQIINSTNGTMIILWENNVPEDNLLVNFIKEIKNSKTIVYL